MYERPRRRAIARWQSLAEVLLVFAVFAIHAGWPIPDVNESQYLVKAKHFWNPGWAADDFFLTASQKPGAGRLADTHAVFYLTTGWLTLWLPLYWYAFVGRAATWLAMAWCFRRLSVALLPVHWVSPLAAALFVMFNERFQMAGEWVVGGFEAKGPAYAIVFLALEAVASARWLRACLLAGVATSLHVLVGGWSALVVLAVWLSDPVARPRRPELLRGVALAAAAALPGLIAALAIDWGTPAAILSRAACIYVYQRLPHHLLPEYFSLDAAARLTILFLFWLFFAWQGSATLAQQRLRTYVLYSVAIAALGVSLSWLCWHRPSWEAQVMRYYWFRLADSALPLGAAFAWLATVFNASSETHQQGPPVVRKRGVGLVAPLLVAGLYLVLQAKTALLADRPRADAPNKVMDYHDWRAAAEWAAEHTPPDAVFLTPRTSQTFKWHGGRGEVVTWKDIPQNAQGVVAWWERLVDIYGRKEYATNSWQYDSLTDQSAQRLRELGRKYAAQYVLTEAAPPLDLPRLYANRTYAIYRLAD